MSDTKPGADELRIRGILRQRGVGPDAITQSGEPTTHTATRKTSPRLPDWWMPKPDISPDSVVEPEPPQRARDWLDDILDSDPSPAGPQPIAEPVAKVKAAPDPAPPAAEPKPDSKPRKSRARREQQASPRESLVDATARIPRRLRWLAYHASAAGAGWWLGWVDWGTNTAAWYAAGNWTAPSAWVLYVLGGLVWALYAGTRTWRWFVAWATAVPVSSVVLGVLLYGTGYHS